MLQTIQEGGPLANIELANKVKKRKKSKNVTSSLRRSIDILWDLMGIIPLKDEYNFYFFVGYEIVIFNKIIKIALLTNKICDLISLNII